MPSPSERASTPGSPILSVPALTRAIADQLAAFGRIRVEGEISGLKRATSGHLYFDLKGEEDGQMAVLSCKIWRSQLARGLAFDPRDGQRVIATGALDLFPPHGRYSLTVDRLEELGLGAALEQLERLKADLRARGWFDRKRALPSLPRAIGVVTSRDAAAWQDFLKTRARRWPDYPVRLCHASVQGAGAARAVADAIRALDRSGVDLVCVIRGGGSLQDLWTFNELPVAEAIHACSVPVVTGIGHETDVTLADLVSDLRAHTPTDAAERAIPDREALVQRLERAGGYLGQAVEWLLERRAERFARVERALATAARERVWRVRAVLDGLSARLERGSPRARLARAQARTALVAARLTPLATRALERRAHALTVLSRALDAVSPLAVLGRGYSIAFRRAEGRRSTVVRDSGTVRAGDELETVFARGSAISRVLATEAAPPAAAEAPAHGATR